MIYLAIYILAIVSIRRRETTFDRYLDAFAYIVQHGEDAFAATADPNGELTTCHIRDGRYSSAYDSFEMSPTVDSRVSHGEMDLPWSQKSSKSYRLRSELRRYHG